MKFWIAFIAAGLSSVVAVSGCAASSPHADSVSPVVTPVNPAAPTTRAGATAAVAAPSGSTANASTDQTIATLDDIVITREELDKPLIEAYGLNMLAKIAQLELTKKNARQVNITVTTTDIATETDRYVNSLFNADKDPKLHEMTDELEKAQAANDSAKIATVTEDLRKERGRLLDQLLTQQKISRPDFDLAMQVNTYLRKIALSAKITITEENLHDAFNNLYGEHVRVRDIIVNDLNEATKVKAQLATGTPFAEVARTMGRNQQIAMVGGELPQFTRSSPKYPQQFKDVAFGLKVGEVSDPVAAGGGYHIILLEERIPPKLVKFEDVRESVRQYLYDLQIEALVKQLHASLQRAVSDNLKILYPELKKQFDEKVVNRDGEIKDKEEVSRDLDRRRKELQEQAATQSMQPENSPSSATQPATQP